MTTDRDVTQAVRLWLDDGASRLPDRVLDAVLEQVPGIPQRRPVWRVWQLPAPRIGAIAVAICAVVVAATLAPMLLPLYGPPGVGNQSTPRPTPSAEESGPTVSPSVREVPSTGPMAGRYRFADVFGSGVNVDFDAPPNWGSCCGGFTEGAGGDIQFNAWVIDVVYPDPCDRSDGPVYIGPSVQDLVDALRAQPGRTPARASPSASTPPFRTEAVTVAGYSGLRLQVQVPFDADFSACTQGDYVAFSGARDLAAWRYSQNPGQIDDLRILDVNGTTLTLQSTYNPTTSQANRAALDGILDTLVITAPPRLARPSASFVATEPPQPAADSEAP